MRPRCIPVFLFGLALSVTFAASCAEAQELTKQAKIERIMALTKMDAMTDRILDQAKTMAVKQSQSSPAMTPEARAKAQEIQDKIFELVKAMAARMRPQIIKLYDAVYSDEEITGMLAFYESPVGRAMIEKMPQLTSQLMTAIQAESANLQSDIQRIIKESA